MLSVPGGVSSRTGSGLPLLPVRLSCVCVCVWSQEKSQKNNQCRKRKNRNEAAVSEAKITQRGKDLRNNGKTNGKKEAMTKKAK